MDKKLNLEALKALIKAEVKKKLKSKPKSRKKRSPKQKKLHELKPGDTVQFKGGELQTKSLMVPQLSTVQQPSFGYIQPKLTAPTSSLFPESQSRNLDILKEDIKKQFEEVKKQQEEQKREFKTMIDTIPKQALTIEQIKQLTPIEQIKKPTPILEFKQQDELIETNKEELEKILDTYIQAKRISFPKVIRHIKDNIFEFEIGFETDEGKQREKIITDYNNIEQFWAEISDRTDEATVYNYTQQFIKSGAKAERLKGGPI